MRPIPAKLSPAQAALCAVLVAVLATGALGAADAPRADAAPAAAAAPPGDDGAPRPLGPGDLVMMDFQDVELSTLIKFISEITGKNFLVDDKVKGKVSVISPSKITVDEAYRVFQSVLQVKGFAIVDTGPVVKIIPTKDIKGSGLPFETSQAEPSEVFVTRLVPLKHLEAAQAASILQPLVSRDGLISAYPPTNSLIVIDTSVNLSRLLQLIGDLDIPGQERTVELIPLKHAYAGDIVPVLREALEDSGTRPRPASGGAPVTTLPGVAPPAGGGAASAAARGDAGVRVVADERSNAVIAIGSSFDIRQVRDLVAKLDRPSPKGTGRVNVYYLRYADAGDMVQVLSDLVGTTANVARRQTLPGRAVTEGGGRFGNAGFSGTSYGSGSGSFARSVIGNSQAGSLGGGLSGMRGRSSAAGYGSAAGGPTSASAGAGPPAVEFESGVRITADSSTNALVIGASPQDYAILKEVIDKLDVARRQVQVEAIIFEVSLTRAKQLGIELQGGFEGNNAIGIARTNFRNIGALTNATSTGDASAIGNISGLLAALISKQQIELANGQSIPASAALLSALQSTTGVNVLSAPTILTTDNEEAEIVVGQNVPFVTSRSTNETNLANTFSQVERRDVGITLRLTPQISEGDVVRLLLFEEVSALVNTPEAQVLQLGPTTTVRSATTNVVVRDSDTVAIGGLISDSLTNTDDGVPYLSDIPVVGNLFKFQDRKKEKVNLIILLTPHIVRDADALSRVSDAERARFREAMVGKGKFAGTQGSLEPSHPGERRVERVGGVLLPAEGPGSGRPAPPPDGLPEER